MRIWTFKNSRQLVAGCEGSTLYLKLINGRKAQTILKGGRHIVMLSKYGRECMKIDLESARRAKNVEMVLYGADEHGGETRRRDVRNKIVFQNVFLISLGYRA